MITDRDITFEERVSCMVRDVEDEGFHLYYDDKTKEWELMNPESEFSVVGKDKIQVIFDGWRVIMLG